VLGPRKQSHFEVTRRTQTSRGTCYVWCVVDVLGANTGGGRRIVLWMPRNCRISVGPGRTTGNSTAGRSDGWRIRVHSIIQAGATEGQSSRAEEGEVCAR
jgi:hypothetical protein